MNIWLLAASIAIAAIYMLVIAIFGFEGFIAYAINFLRIVSVTAMLIMFIPAIPDIFQRIPPPHRDYLLAGIVLQGLSAFGFAVSNEAGRFFHYQTSVYLNPVAGGLSLLLVLGCMFLILAPGITSKRKSLIAVAVGIAVGSAVVFIAQLFR